MSKPATESPLSAFAKSIEQSVILSILPALVKFVNDRIAQDAAAEKQYEDFTEEEIIRGLKMSKVRVAPNFTPGGVSSSAASKPAAPRKSTATEDEVEGKCHFRITRGPDEGKCCGKKAVDGTDYCSSPSHIDGGKERKAPASKKGSTSAFTRKPTKTAKEEEDETDGDVELELLHELENDVLVLTGNLVVTQGKNDNDEDEYTLYGIQVEGQTIKPLTSVQVKKYKAQNFVIETDEDVIAELGLIIEKPKETTTKKTVLPPPPSKKTNSAPPVTKKVTTKVDEPAEPEEKPVPPKKTAASAVRPPVLNKKTDAKQAPPPMPPPPAAEDSKDESAESKDE
jgi:hypothetical protein